MEEDNNLLKSQEDLINLFFNWSWSKGYYEKYIISSVFYNRIKKDMKLQSDPTFLL